MKFIALIIFSSVLSNFAVAAQNCDFSGYLSDDRGIRKLGTLMLNEDSKLTTAQANEVMYAAINLEGAVARGLTPKKAITALSDNSEAGDLYYMTMKKRGQVYTMVKYFPGGNPVGFIFKNSVAVAKLSDDDASCL